MSEDESVTRVGRDKGRRSPMWAFMAPYRIPAEGDVYVQRLRLIETPLFRIWLHRIYRPDRDLELHDHPCSFLSIVLCGSYDEQVYRGDDFTRPPVARHVRWFNLKRAERPHRISWVSRSPVWTLVLGGPRRREWGFWRDGCWIVSDRFVSR